MTFRNTILTLSDKEVSIIKNLIYEPHIIKDPLIPFFFHTDIEQKNNKCCVLNWHTNIELLYCTDGEGTVICENTKYTFEKGDIFVVNANELHDIISDSEVTYFCLILDKDFCAENGIDTEYLHFTAKIRDEELNRLYEDVAEAYNYFGVCRATKIRCAVLSLLIKLRTDYTESSIGKLQDKNPGTERIKRAMVYIRQNLSKAFTLEEIADYVGISKFYLTREFKRITGQSVFEYINIIRCKEATRLISEGQTVSAAARSCGFENMSYFSRTYKKCIGSAPSKSRNEGMQ